MSEYNKDKKKEGSYAMYNNKEEIVTLVKDVPPKQDIGDATTATGNQECFTYCKTGLAKKRAANLKLKLPLDPKAGKLSASNLAKRTTLQFIAMALLFLGFAFKNDTVEEWFM